MKRAFDIALCLLLAVPAFLVVVPLAVLVYLEDHHWPFYGGNRIGKGGRVYKLYKLRSMVVDAEKLGADATPANDPRITKVGHFLRRHKLDELTQLWNVFRGDMSFVGPRPNCQREYDMYSPEEKRILSILPGITDIASIVFSDEQNILKDTADPDLGYHQLVRPWKSRMCLIYADNISLRLDIELLVLTGVVLFFRSLALSGVQRIMRRLKAEEQLTLVARRDVPLVPCPPLGMNTVVQTVPGKIGKEYGSRSLMKVLLLNQAFYPDNVSTSQYVTDLALFLKDLGAEVTVVAGQRDYANLDIVYAATENYQGIRIYRIPTKGLGKRRFLARVIDSVTYDLLSILRLLRLPKQDMVIAFTSPPLVGVLGALFCRVRGGKFIHWIMNINHEMAMEIGYLRRSSPLAWLLRKLYRFTLASSHKIVVMDRWMADKVKKELPESHKLVTLPLWPVHDPEFDVSPHADRTNPFREKYHLHHKFIIAHSGNLMLIHPLETLLDTAVRLKDNPDIVFAFIGYGQREKDIDEVVKKHNLTNILRLPYQPREVLGIALSFADLQLVIMGDKASGLAHSSKIYSILATGKPYLFIGPKSSHIVGDILEKCPYGFHVEHGDVKGMLDVIKKVRSFSLEELAQFRRQNRAFVTEHFTRDHLLSRFVVEVMGNDTFPRVTPFR